MTDKELELAQVGEIYFPADVREQRELTRSLAAETPQEALESAASDGLLPQGAMLVMAEVAAGKLDSLRACLDEMLEPDIEYNSVLPFLRLRSVHFARFLIHEEARDLKGRVIPAKLLFATDFDGSLGEHVDELLREGRAGLERAFQHCVGFPESSDPNQLRLFLVAHMERDAATVYVGTGLRSVLQIRREAELRDAIEDYLDRAGPGSWTGKDPLAIRAGIIEFVKADERLKWAMRRPGGLPQNRKVGRAQLWIGLAAALVFFPITLALLAVLLVAALVLRIKEIRDPVVSPDVTQRARELARDEDYIVQNQMSSVLNIKPGAFRSAVLRTVLAGIRFAAPNFNREGMLGGIPSIHVARWVIVDDGRRLLFFSNYDGSWENYLGDFIDKASIGLTGVWSNCVGFPRTLFLLWQGSRDEQKFKRYTRNSMIPTQVWYSAYKQLSVQNINNNSAIRLGLHDRMTAEQAAAWLRRF